MHQAQAPYRELYDSILAFEGDGLQSAVLEPWLGREPQERAWLTEFAARVGAPIPPASREDLWRLYALSRVSDLLLARPKEREILMLALGLQPLQSRGFSPFFHEIASVEQAPLASEAVSVTETVWPGWRLGPMMFARAGVRVRAGTDHIVKEIAETSMLYWSFARPQRRTMDLSVGWGSNSQWRTSFRRDYELCGEFLYNVDARPTSGPAGDEDLTDDEASALLRNRCFVRTRKPDDDRWPYDSAWREPAHG